jgi:hypothetical protein
MDLSGGDVKYATDLKAETSLVKKQLKSLEAIDLSQPPVSTT